MLALTSEPPIWAHRLPAGVKLAALCVGTVVLFAAPWPLTTLALGAGLAAGLYASGGGVFLRLGLRSLRGLTVLAAILFAWMWLTRDWQAATLQAGRLLVAVALANFVTLTTRLDQMSDVFQRLFALMGLPAQWRARIALALALAIRFIPVLSEKGARLALAWRARSNRRAGAALVMPMVLSAIDEAEQVAEALRARGGV